MKRVTMFMMESCPYCQRAFRWMEEIFNEHPEYQGVELTVIDESLEPDVADRYDYWYVPTYYINGQKVHEDAATKEIVARVFAQAHGAQAGKVRAGGE